jgi:hypothetical protein
MLIRLGWSDSRCTHTSYSRFKTSFTHPIFCRVLKTVKLMALFVRDCSTNGVHNVVFQKRCTYYGKGYLWCRSEEARRVGVVCKHLHVAQPEVGINISLSDESDIIEFSVFC